MSCVMSTTYAIGAFLAIWVIDRFPRRTFMMGGAVATSIPFIILTALVSRAEGSHMGWAAAAMIILFVFVFALTWDCLPWIYGSEVSIYLLNIFISLVLITFLQIMPLSLRHVNGAVGAFGEWIFQFTVLGKSMSTFLDISSAHPLNLN